MRQRQGATSIGLIAGTSPSLREAVEKSVSAAIVSGELAAGELVSVPALALRFGVSATPVREAMLDLEKRGFVEPVRNKGFRITFVEEADLREIAQVRRWLEVPAIRIAAAHFPLDQLSRFRRLADEIVRAAAAGDFPTYLAADSAFHLALVTLAANERLVELVAELRSQTRMVGLASMKGTAELERSSLEHHALLDLLVEGNADEAAALLDAHIEHVVGWWAGKGEPVPKDTDKHPNPNPSADIDADPEPMNATQFREKRMP
jgi:DNA-binding GntR family transcriptional regulator